jgi:hypothetical protein
METAKHLFSRNTVYLTKMGEERIVIPRVYWRVSDGKSEGPRGLSVYRKGSEIH